MHSIINKIKIMKNYKKINTCLNCKFVFKLDEYDEESLLFCNINNDRPVCNSVYMKEKWNIDDSVSFSNQMKIWNMWSKLHEVNYNGICDLYEKEK